MTDLSWLLDLMSSWMSACLLSESVSIVLKVVLISPADFLSSRTKSKNMWGVVSIYIRHSQKTTYQKRTKKKGSAIIFVRFFKLEFHRDKNKLGSKQRVYSTQTLPVDSYQKGSYSRQDLQNTLI